MFANHQPIISEYARQSPDNMARVLKFVILTIRARLFNIPADMETLDNESLVDSDAMAGILYGFKAESIAHIESEKESLYAQAESIAYHAETPRDMAESLLNLFTSIYGLGLAKAGFCAQLIYGVSACLDTHNLIRFGISSNVIKNGDFDVSGKF